MASSLLVCLTMSPGCYSVMLSGLDIGARGNGGDIWPRHFRCFSLCHLGKKIKL